MEIGWDEFVQVELRAGTLIEVEDFPQGQTVVSSSAWAINVRPISADRLWQ